jgi:LuxR family glucitol operon transcriptional activator
MASFQRLALYLVFDAVERDMINFLRRSTQNTKEILTQDERFRAKERIIKRDRQDLYNIDDDYDLLHGLDLGDKFNIILMYKTEIPPSESKYLISIKTQIDKAIPIRNDVMHGDLLPWMIMYSVFR